jgi:hypothetical protein
MSTQSTRLVVNIVISAAVVRLLLSSAMPCSAENAAAVMSLQLPEQANPEVRKTQNRLYQLALHQAHAILPSVHPWEKDPGLKLATQSKSIEHFIRPNTAAIANFAFLCRFGTYDEKIVGVSRGELLKVTIIPMMRYIAATHVTGPLNTSDGKKWGDQWQSAYWAQMLGRSAWWLWDDLPDDLHESVRRVVNHEADRFIGQTPPHNLEHDTKAEENAWNSTIFDMAILLLPADAKRLVWEKEFQRWVMSSYLRPADDRSAKLVDGRPVSEQFTGANIYDDFTLENHDIVHPDYMGCFALTVTCAIDHALSGRRAPEAIGHNTREVYGNLKWFFLPDGGCVYPNGEDWELFNNAFDWSEVNSYMASFAGDPDAWPQLMRNLATGEAMQARDSSGALYKDEETVYGGAQLLAGEQIARVWLALQTFKNFVGESKPLLGVKRLDAGKLILHRTPTAVHTLSWGSVIMAQCVPWRMDRVVSPDQRDGVGQVRRKGDKKILPVKLVSADVQDSADGFTADLVVDHGDAVRANLNFRSNADGSFVIREKLTALGDMTTSEIATGLIGVLNNPLWVYESHRRKIALGDERADVPALSGKTLKADGVRQIDVDGVLKIESPAPLSAAYLGTKKIERGRATDKLYLNYLGGERNWTKGQAISVFEATITPRGEPPRN